VTPASAGTVKALFEESVSRDLRPFLRPSWHFRPVWSAQITFWVTGVVGWKRGPIVCKLL
jgi:hypothetical protein